MLIPAVILATLALAGVAIFWYRRQRENRDRTPGAVERRRGHRQAVGPDGKPLLLGAAVRREPEVVDPVPDTEQAEPEVQPQTQNQAAAQKPTQHQPTTNTSTTRTVRTQKAPVPVVSDRNDGLTLILGAQQFNTPLWGRSPREAFRDLYAYALYTHALDTSGPTSQH